MNQSLVSIIIPTYNRAHLIDETLDSILSQTYFNWECIIVDDGSTDNTDGVVSNYMLKDSRFQYFTRPINKPKGPNSCRNFGFKMSKGDYVHWFDSDDIYFPFALDNYVNFLDKATEVAVAKLEIADFLTGIKIKENTIISDNLIEDYFVGKIAHYVCGPLWKRSFLEKQIYLFDEAIRNLDDWDFNLRMLYQNPIIEFIDKPLIQYRVHTESLSHEIGKLNFQEIQSELFAREKHLILIFENKKANPTILKKFIKDRCKYFFREALIQKDEKRYYYLKILLQKQCDLRDYLGMLKTLFGLIVFSVFNKGYKILK